MIRALAIVFALLLAASAARADIAFVSASDLGDNGGGGNYTVSFTATGANLLLISVVGDVANGPGNDDITGVTYAGVSATFITKYATSSAGAERFSYLYYLLRPAPSSNSIVVSSTNSHFLLVGAAAYSGAGSSGTIPGASSSSIDSGSNNIYTTTLSTAPDRAWAMLLAENGATSVACSAGATLRAFGATYTDWGLCDSNGQITPPQSYSMTASLNPNANGFFQTHLMASFGPDSGGLMMRGCCN